MRKLILYISTEFPNTPSWRFIPAEFQFNNPSDPFESQFPEVYSINDLSEEMDIDFVAIKVRNPKQELIAFLLFAKRNQTLKLPYFYCNADIATIIPLINLHLLKWRIKTFSCYHSALVNYLQQHSTLALYKKKIQRGYLITDFFKKENLDHESYIQDGDGDCAFT